MTDKDIHEFAVALGRSGGLKGGRKGGRSRSAAKVAAGRRNIAKATASLSPEKRRERAKKAAAARWKRPTE